MELLVFGHAGARVLVFPTRQGRFFDYENWGLVNSLRPTIEAGNLQLFCVDSVDSESLYCRTIAPELRVRRHNQFENYLLKELLPMSRQRNPNPFVIAHGCSIGAYHAVNVALRHPTLFGKVVALSGRYDLTTQVGVFADLFEGFYNQDVYFHTPNHFVNGLSDHHVLTSLRRLDIVLAVGEEDPFFASTVGLSRSLESKQIPHRLAIWPGEAHRAKSWRDMVTAYL